MLFGTVNCWDKKSIQYAVSVQDGCYGAMLDGKFGFSKFSGTSTKVKKIARA